MNWCPRQGGRTERKVPTAKGIFSLTSSADISRWRDGCCCVKRPFPIRAGRKQKRKGNRRGKRTTSGQDIRCCVRHRLQFRTKTHLLQTHAAVMQAMHSWERDWAPFRAERNDGRWRACVIAVSFSRWLPHATANMEMQEREEFQRRRRPGDERNWTSISLYCYSSHGLDQNEELKVT